MFRSLSLSPAVYPLHLPLSLSTISLYYSLLLKRHVYVCLCISTYLYMDFPLSIFFSKSPLKSSVNYSE